MVILILLPSKQQHFTQLQQNFRRVLDVLNNKLKIETDEGLQVIREAIKLPIIAFGLIYWAQSVVLRLEPTFSEVKSFKIKFTICLLKEIVQTFPLLQNEVLKAIGAFYEYDFHTSKQFIVFFFLSFFPFQFFPPSISLFF